MGVGNEYQWKKLFSEFSSNERVDLTENIDNTYCTCTVYVYVYVQIDIQRIRDIFFVGQNKIHIHVVTNTKLGWGS